METNHKETQIWTTIVQRGFEIVSLLTCAAVQFIGLPRGELLCHCVPVSSVCAAVFISVWHNLFEVSVPLRFAVSFLCSCFIIAAESSCLKPVSRVFSGVINISLYQQI
jgi:hypothetical protein